MNTTDTASMVRKYLDELSASLGRDMGILKNDMETLCYNQNLLLEEIKLLREDNMTRLKNVKGNK